MVKEQKPLLQAAPVVSSAVVQDGPSVILRCSQWTDFQVLAMHAQTLFFTYKEAGKFFQANAISGNQLIIYAGALPNFSPILKTWLSFQLDITEPNILEGSLDKPK